MQDKQGTEGGRGLVSRGAVSTQEGDWQHTESSHYTSTVSPSPFPFLWSWVHIGYFSVAVI